MHRDGDKRLDQANDVEQDADDELALAESSDPEASIAGEPDAQYETDAADTLEYESSLRSLRAAAQRVGNDDPDRRS